MKDTINGLNGSPWWVKAIAWLGIPAAVTAFMLGQSAGWIPNAATQEHRLIADKLATGFRVICENNARSRGDEESMANCGNIR